MTGCGNSSSSTSETKQTENSVTEEQTTSVQKESETDENQEAADQLLCDLKGTYQELWPVILADEYDQLWLDDSAAIVGESPVKRQWKPTRMEIWHTTVNFYRI